MVPERRRPSTKATRKKQEKREEFLAGAVAWCSPRPKQHGRRMRSSYSVDHELSCCSLHKEQKNEGTTATSSTTATTIATLSSTTATATGEQDEEDHDLARL